LLLFVIIKSNICLSLYVGCLTCWVRLKRFRILRNSIAWESFGSSMWKLKSPIRIKELEVTANCSRKCTLNSSKNIFWENLFWLYGGSRYKTKIEVFVVNELNNIPTISKDLNFEIEIFFNLRDFLKRKPTPPPLDSIGRW